MRKVVVILFVTAVCLALPLAASQFIQMPFDKLVRTSSVIVHGKVGPISSAWNDSGDVIFSRANIEVNRYLVGVGPGIIPVREVGGTVAGYSQQAIGFPELREGEEVVLILTRWDDSDEYRIHAYRQGKYVVRPDGAGKGRVMLDDLGQGDEPSMSASKRADRDDGMLVEEFEQMIEAALVGGRGARTE